MSKRILVVEDDKKIASFVANGLKQSGFAVDHCPDGEQGLIFARSNPYDAAVIDIMLPKLDGLTLVQTLRREKIRIPVLILSARRSVDEHIGGAVQLPEHLPPRFAAQVQRETTFCETTKEQWTALLQFVQPRRQRALRNQLYEKLQDVFIR